MSLLSTRQLGRTGVEVSVLGFGAAELRGEHVRNGPPLSTREVEVLVMAVVDAGINFIDTAGCYGLSEERLGAVLARRRDEVVLATKCGCVVGEVPPELSHQRIPHWFAPENLIAGVERSLRRLGTDRIDLLQIHARPGPSRQLLAEERVIETLQTLQRQGKVRFLGSSTVLPDLRDHIDLHVFDAFQVPFSALDWSHAAELDYAAREGAGTIIRGAVAQGWPGTGRSADRWKLWNSADLDSLLGEGMTRMEFMARFAMSHPSISTILVGTSKLEHLESNVRSFELGPLPSALYEESTRRLALASKARDAEDGEPPGRM